MKISARTLGDASGSIPHIISSHVRKRMRENVRRINQLCRLSTAFAGAVWMVNPDLLLPMARIKNIHIFSADRFRDFCIDGVHPLDVKRLNLKRRRIARPFHLLREVFALAGAVGRHVDLDVGNDSAAKIATKFQNIIHVFSGRTS